MKTITVNLGEDSYPIFVGDSILSDKKLLNQYVSEGVLKERLILNHIIVFYNVFPPAAATRILFFKIEEKFWPMLKPFLFYLQLMPENKIESINGKDILVNDISMDQGVVNSLRKFDRES